MELDMKTRNKVCGQIFKRYQKAGKKDKSNILDEYSATLKMNRDLPDDYVSDILDVLPEKQRARWCNITAIKQPFSARSVMADS